MGVAASTAPVGVAIGATSVGLVTAWFIILLLTTSMGLVTAVPRRPAMKLALWDRCVCVCVCVSSREHNVKLCERVQVSVCVCVCECVCTCQCMCADVCIMTGYQLEEGVTLRFPIPQAPPPHLTLLMY